MLRAREVDAAVAVLPFDGSTPPGIDCRLVWERPLYVAIRSTHAAAALERIAPADLAGEPLVALNTPGWAMGALYGRIGVEAPAIVVETFQGMIDAVAEGVGYALTSVSSFTRDQVSLVPLAGHTIASGVIWRSGDGSPAVQRLLAAARLLARD
jgi:DNA-binding transcriptional LysR family regulator